MGSAAGTRTNEEDMSFDLQAAKAGARVRCRDASLRVRHLTFDFIGDDGHCIAGIITHPDGSEGLCDWDDQGRFWAPSGEYRYDLMTGSGA